jgi:hypothetical protein
MADHAAVGSHFMTAAEAAAPPPVDRRRSGYLLGIEVTSSSNRLRPGLLLINGLGELSAPDGSAFCDKKDREIGTVDWSATFDPGGPFMAELRRAEAELSRLECAQDDAVHPFIACQSNRVEAACELRVRAMMDQFDPILGGQGEHDGWTKDIRVYLLRKSDGKVLTLTRDAFVGISEHSDTHYRAMLNLRQDSQGGIFGTGRPSPFRLGLIELHAVTCELVDESAKQKVEASRTVHALWDGCVGQVWHAP